jgi:thioredoxin reductase
VKLSVVEMGDRMVPRMMGPTAGGMIRDWCETKGVEVFTSTKVESIEPGTPMSVKLSNGKTMLAELVISAAGVRPAIGFMENSGVTCLLGVLTDEHLQTNVPGVFAAGDCIAKRYRQVTTAVGDGTIATLSAIEYLRNHS